MMIPYHHTKAFGQVPCEDVAMRIPIPEEWIYLFRTEKAHVSLSQLAAGNLNLSSRMGAVKSAHRRAGKVRHSYCTYNFEKCSTHYSIKIPPLTSSNLTNTTIFR